MDFAKKILCKYGWKEGDGLGKNNNGIVKPLKANLKFDNAGLGADQASDFNNRWWERVYNEATQNVEIKKRENGALSMTAKEESIEISTKGYSLKKLKKAKKMGAADEQLYGNFLQSSTLTRAGEEIENPNKVDLTDISVPEFQAVTDEEMFKACKGRTAHKGARHGLKLSGKLARLEQQEQILLEKILKKNYGQEKDIKDVVNAKSKKSKKKKKDKVSNAEAIGRHHLDELAEPPRAELSITLPVSKKQKRRKAEEPELANTCTLETEPAITKKKKKRKKNSSEKK